MILTRDIFWFFMPDNSCIIKTVNDGNTDLAQHPAAKVRQMAKQLESSKATAKHIKQHRSNMQGGAQINALRHNHTSQPARRKRMVRNQTQVKAPSHSNHSSKGSHTGNSHRIKIQINTLDVVISNMHQDLTACSRSANAKLARKLDNSPKYDLPKMHIHNHSNI